MHIHLARWLVTPDRPPLENAGIATFGNRIIAVDKATLLMRTYHGKVIDHGDAIICPPLVNAHCHLELATLDYLLKPGEGGPGSFTRWVGRLMALRSAVEEHQWSSAIEDAVFQLVDNGVAILADVGNTGHVPLFVERSGAMWPLRGFFFHEIIAPSQGQLPSELINCLDDTVIRLSSEDALPFFRALSAHAPYTVSPFAIRAINAWSMRQGVPFTIHAAESEDETALLMDGAGPIRELMDERGHWPPDWEMPGMSSIRYLDSLGCLHDRSVCVHCVQVDQKDIEIIASRRASVCLCPRSNQFTGVGNAPVYEMYRAGINLAVGTDSLASNRKLSILSEMAEIAAIAPEMPPEAILKAATLGGSRALGVESETGTLEKGKNALLLVVQANCSTGMEAMEFLVNQAHKGSVNATLVEA